MTVRFATLSLVFAIIACTPPPPVRRPPPGTSSDAAVEARDARTATPTDHDASGGSTWYADSDGDGVADAVESYAGTDPSDPSESPRTRGDFFFVVPYREAPVPPRDTLVFGTSIQRADVHFMIDTSISMQPYINRVRTALTSAVIPGIAAAISDVWLGVGEFDVCPGSGHRPDICRGVAIDQASTSDGAAVERALASLTADCAPVHEPYAQAAWLWATGETSRFPGMAPRACPSGAIGLACVREGSLPILVVIGDEPFSESYRTGFGCGSGAGGCAACAEFPASSDVISAFAAIRGRLIVIGSTGSSPEWGPIVSATGAVDGAGRPLVFPFAGSAEVDRAIVDAIQELAASTPLDVSARAVDLDDDGIDASALVERVEANTAGGVADRRDPTRVCLGGLPATDTDGDGHADTFPDVAPGTLVCFDIVVRQNEIVPPAEEPRILRAQIEVIGDGVTVLDRRTVYFLVPGASGSPVLI